MGATVKCLNKLMTLACRKKKNYIIDQVCGLTFSVVVRLTCVRFQTNCYPLARKKKMTAFKDFHRKAVVIVPTAENHADRLLRQGMTEGKQMPPEALLEMKGTRCIIWAWLNDCQRLAFSACFTLPKEEDELFDEIEFVELGREEAQRVVEQYNEEGKAFKPPEPKKRRGGDWMQQQENQNPSTARKEQAGTQIANGMAQGYGQNSRQGQDGAVLQQVSSKCRSSF